MAKLAAIALAFLLAFGVAQAAMDTEPAGHHTTMVESGDGNTWG